MASIAGVMNTFSTQTSMAAAPLNCDPDPVGVNKGKRDAYTVSRALQTEAERAFCAPLASLSFLPGRPEWVFGVERSSCKTTPLPAYASLHSTTRFPHPMC